LDGVNSLVKQIAILIFRKNPIFPVNYAVKYGKLPSVKYLATSLDPVGVTSRILLNVTKIAIGGTFSMMERNLKMRIG